MPVRARWRRSVSPPVTGAVNDRVPAGKKGHPFGGREAPSADRNHCRKEAVPLGGPVIVRQVKFTEWTRDDQLRHRVFLGIRTDKKAEEVARERAS